MIERNTTWIKKIVFKTGIYTLQMLRGKLDKLLIENFWYLGYLSKDNADSLRTVKLSILLFFLFLSCRYSMGM